eukprot:PhF_6_TR31420/c0_g1_i1/m.46061/K04986/PKD2; polycystin 2
MSKAVSNTEPIASSPKPKESASPKPTKEKKDKDEEQPKKRETVNLTAEEKKKRMRKEEQEKERKRIQETRLPLKFTIDTLRSDAVGKELMREMSLYIPFLVSFMFFFFAGRDVEQAYFSVASTKAKLIQKDVSGLAMTVPAIPNVTGPRFPFTYPEVAISDDFYNWLEGVVIQEFWDRKNPTAVKNITRISGQSIAIGGLRVRMLKVRNNSCTINPYFYPDDESAFTRDCYGRYTPEKEDKTSFTQNDITFNYTEGCKHSYTAISGEITTYPCGGFIRDVPFTVSYNDAIKWASDLRNGQFIDNNAVRFIVVEFFTYNPGLDSFSANRIFTEVTAGGGWLPTSRFRNFEVFKPSGGRLAYEFYFLCFILYYWYRFFLDWRRSGKGLGYLFSLWPFFEIVNLCAFIVVFIARWVWWRASQDQKWTLPYTKDAFPDDLDYIQNMYQIQVYFNSLNCVLSFLKLLKFVRLNNRLNILTRTLEACAQNIMGVLILFVLVVFAYSIAGCTLFGGGLADFRNISTAFSTCMRIVIGNFDYQGMKEENRSVAFIYFWTFVVLANFVLLNFIIAVISEGFEEEAKKTKAVPLEFYITRYANNAKHYFSSVGTMFKELYNAIVARTRRLPEVTILEHLVRHRTQQLNDLRLTEEMVESGIFAEPELWFGRQDFKKILPRSELDYVTEDTLNFLWEDIVIEFELANKMENLTDEARLKRAHREEVLKSFTNTLTSPDVLGHLMMFQDKQVHNGQEDIKSMISLPQRELKSISERTSKLEKNITNIKQLMKMMTDKVSTFQGIGPKA